MSQFGDFQWGNVGWGNFPPQALAPFTDLGGNALASPAQSSAVFGELTADSDTTRIYDLHIRAVRDIDAAGSLFWKRLCAGPELVWADIETRQGELTSLYNVDTIEDGYLKYLKLSAGWTADTDIITEAMSDSALRQLIAQSPELWDRRGAGGAYTEILNATIGVDAWEVDWFDKRWELDASPLGADGFEFGAMVLDKGERYFTDIHVADAGRGIDRQLAAESLKLWRPANERIRVVWVELFDVFDDDSNPNSWQVATVGGGPPVEATVSGGSVTVPADSIAYTTSDYIVTKSDYMVRATVTPETVAGFMGVVVRHDALDPSTAIELRFNMDALTFEVSQNSAQLAGTTITDISNLGIFVAGFARSIRVEVQGNRFAVWLDNEPIYRFTTNLANSAGTAGALTGPGVAATMNFFEMQPLPSETMTVGTGGKVETT